MRLSSLFLTFARANRFPGRRRRGRQREREPEEYETPQCQGFHLTWFQLALIIVIGLFLLSLHP